MRSVYMARNIGYKRRYSSRPLKRYSPYKGIRRTSRRTIKRRPRLYRKSYSSFNNRFISRSSFRKKVSVVAAQNSGLHVAQIFEGYNFETTTSGAITFNYTEVSRPALLVQMGILTSGQDSKVFLEKGHVSVRLFNNSNVPVVLRRVWFKVKKNIPISVYATPDALLQDGAPSFSTLASGDPLTSNAAQRYLKWLRMKTYVLGPGKVRIFNQKQVFKRFVTGDVEGNAAFLFTKGNTGSFYFMDGVPMTSDDDVDIATGPVSCQMVHSHKITWRSVQDITNDSTIPSGGALPPITGYGDIVMPTVQVQPPQIA